MGLITELRPEQVVERATDALFPGEGPSRTNEPAIIAASLRRIASFSCPATPFSLATVVVEGLRGLHLESSEDELKSIVTTTLEDLIAHGDLIEAPLPHGEWDHERRMVFLGPPSYVSVADREYLLLGVRADGASLVGEAVGARIHYDQYVRRLTLERGEDSDAVLGTAGLRELTVEQWLKSPKACTAEKLVTAYDSRLDAAGPAGTIENARVLDPSQPVTYYRGRWRQIAESDHSRFLARRPLEFGPDAWCYAHVEAGEITKLVDLPTQNQLHRACDEAWRLQAAIDAIAGHPQQVRVDQLDNSDQFVLSLLSPVPSWQQRRLDVVASRVPPTRGSLMSYHVSEKQLEEELSFLRSLLWTEIDSEGIQDDG